MDQNRGWMWSSMLLALVFFGLFVKATQILWKGH